MSEIVEVGDIICCPKCDRDLLLCEKQPEPCSTNYPECFKDIGWGGKVGDKTICPDDGESWMITHPFAIHVKSRGWLNG